MAEMLDAAAAALAPEPASAPAASDASEFRIATDLIEAPASLRGAAIARIMADKIRAPNTPNVPCWDSEACREVQLGVPSPSPVESSVGPTAEATAELSADVSVETFAEIPA